MADDVLTARRRYDLAVRSVDVLHPDAPAAVAAQFHRQYEEAWAGLVAAVTAGAVAERARLRDMLKAALRSLESAVWLREQTAAARARLRSESHGE